MPMSFIFGEGTNTPDAATLQRRRQMVDQLRQASTSRAPQTFGEGLTAIGQALAGRMQDKRLSEQETAERERVGGRFSEIAGGLLGGQQPQSPGGFFGGGPAQPRDPMAPQTSSAPLTANPHGLPEAAVAAVDRVDPRQNFPASLIQSESGGNWNALNNEVGAGGVRGHGGRLQFGNARLQDAARAGIIPQGVTPQQFAQMPEDVQQRVENWHFADIDSEIRKSGLDQMIGQSINGVPVTLDGLRAVAHLGGTGGMKRFVESGGQYNPSDSFGTSLMNYFQSHGGQQGGAQPQQPQGGMSQYIAELAEMASNPYLSDGQRMVVQQLLQQQMQQPDPMQQLQMEKAQLEIQQMRNPQPNMTGTQREYEMARQQGFQGSFLDYQNALAEARRPQTNLTTNIHPADNTPRLGSLSSDYGYVLGEDGQPVIDPETGLPTAAAIPGSPAYMAQREAEAASSAKARNASDYARTVTQDIGVAFEYLDSMGPMVGADGVIGANLRAARANLKGTPENNIKVFVDSALSNLTLDTMNRMRETSPAGATGMGNMSDKQLSVIQGVLGQWKPELPMDEQRFILGRLGNFYLDVQVGTKAEREQAVKDGRMTPEENAEIQSLYWPETRDQIGRRIGGTEPVRIPADEPEDDIPTFNPQTGRWE